MDKFEELDGTAVNPSTEPAIGEVISRRTMLKGMAASSAFGLFGCGTMSAASSSDPAFTEVPRSSGEGIQVPPGYKAQVLLRQGDPIKPGAPEYNPATQTGEQQEQQFGTDADFISYMPLPLGSKSSTRGLLGVNHENHRAAICFPGNPKQLTRQQVEVQMAAQGFSITEIAKEGNQWRVVKDSRYNRRISGNAPMRIAGPAAGHERMRTSCRPDGHAFVRHAQQLRRRHHAVGHDADRGREHPELLHRRRGQGAGGGRAQALQHQRQGAIRRLGRATSTASTSTRSRTSRTASAGSSRSIRTIRTTPR